MNKNTRITRFERESVKSYCIELKIGWPLYVWRAIVPEVMINELDVLQRFVLSLAKIGRLKDHELVRTLGLSEELIDTVINSCIDSMFLDKNGDITDEGISALSEDVKRNADVENHKYEKVYIFRDALTGDVVPQFSIVSLPQPYKEEKDRWVLPYDKSYQIKPNFNEIARAMEQRKFIENQAKSIAQDYSTEDLDPASPSLEFPFDLSMDDEVDWEKVDDDGVVSVQQEEKVAATEERRKNKTYMSRSTYIKIWDETPELIYADASVFVDPDTPNRIFVMSPFGFLENTWFTNHLSQSQRDDVREELDSFLEIAMEELSEKYPLNNQLDIDLFVQFPSIANNPEHGELRDQLESVKRAYNRIKDGHMDYDTFYMRCQRTLECILDESIAKISNRVNLANRMGKYDFVNSLRVMSEMLNIRLPGNYFSTQFADRMEKVAKGRGISSKDRALFLILDAYYNKEEAPSCWVFHDMPEFYESINLVCDARNKTAHYSKSAIDNSTLTEKVMDQLERLIRVLFSHFMRR